jgi:hypothetical protein
MLLSSPGTDSMVASRDMGVVLPSDNFVGGQVVIYLFVMHCIYDNQC